MIFYLFMHNLLLGRVLKSNSRAHVPQAHHRASSQSAAISERNSYNMQRRTQSEAPATNKTVESKESPQKAQKPRLAEVRPRYLEPRKARATTVQSNAGPIRSATTASIPTVTKAKARQLSSSESSRTSSPAARKNVAANNNRVGTRSTNMSMDNLTGSSLRRGKSSSRGRSSDNERYSDLGGIDSRADSMKSSVITNKTVSQESLHLYNRPTLASANKQQAKQLEAAKSSSQQKLNKAASNLKVNKHLQAPTSNGSSPSSVNTNKSATSRLSSVSSQHSARDLYNKNRSISVPAAAAANSDEKQQRKSFISAKSREILAKRAEKNKQLQQKSQTNLVQNSSGDEKSSNQSHSNKSTAGIGGGIMRSASHSVVPTASSSTFSNQNTRNSLPPSNIPTRRPNTLNLRKTNGYNRINANKSNSSSNTNLAANTNTNSNANTQNGKQKTTNITTNGVMKAAQAVKQKLELLIDATHQTAEPIKRIESKLERSSTFCKESSDLDLNELQIIE